ncbi:hypothetical protein [Nostoc flagelliforme]|nr:hypothetical protein [Nostoc flagelliforme]
MIHFCIPNSVLIMAYTSPTSIAKRSHPVVTQQQLDNWLNHD